jgi:hypothetical protein
MDIAHSHHLPKSDHASIGMGKLRDAVEATLPEAINRAIECLERATSRVLHNDPEYSEFDPALSAVILLVGMQTNGRLHYSDTNERRLTAEEVLSRIHKAGITNIKSAESDIPIQLQLLGKLCFLTEREDCYRLSARPEDLWSALHPAVQVRPATELLELIRFWNGMTHSKHQQAEATVPLNLSEPISSERPRGEGSPALSQNVRPPLSNRLLSVDQRCCVERARERLIHYEERRDLLEGFSKQVELWGSRFSLNSFDYSSNFPGLLGLVEQCREITGEGLGQDWFKPRLKDLKMTSLPPALHSAARHFQVTRGPSSTSQSLNWKEIRASVEDWWIRNQMEQPRLTVCEFIIALRGAVAGLRECAPLMKEETGEWKLRIEQDARAFYHPLKSVEKGTDIFKLQEPIRFLLRDRGGLRANLQRNVEALLAADVRSQIDLS